MADTWTQAMLAFDCSNAEMALLQEAVLTVADLAGDFEPDPPSREFLAVFPPFGARIEGGNSIERPDRSVVHVFGTTEFEPNAVALLIQRCCRESLEQAPIGFEHCRTCSKPRAGEFAVALRT